MKTFTSLISLVSSHDTEVRKLSRLEEIRAEISATKREEITDCAPELKVYAGPVTGLGTEIRLRFTAEDIGIYVAVLDLLIKAMTINVNELERQLKEHQHELFDDKPA